MGECVIRSVQAVVAHDGRLARGGEQRARLAPQVHRPVAEAVVQAVDADVDEHPLGRFEAHDAQRVVETRAGVPATQRL